MDSLEDYIGAARAAVANHDWPKALALWGQAAENFPQQSAGILGMGETLAQMGRLDEAEAAFAEAMQTFPGNVWGAAGHAGVAARRRDWHEALRRWEAVLEEFPDQAVGHLGKGEALREMGRLDEAEAIFANAMERFPTNLWAAANHAIIAARLCDWGEALNRWEGIKETFPDHAVGYVGYGEALRDTGRFDEADAAFAEAEERFPSDVWAATNHAGLAARRQDWTEALRRWEIAKTRFPNHAAVYLGLAETLVQLGRLGDADTLLTAAVERLPDHEWAAVTYARIAMQRRDWEEASNRWDIVIQRFPRNPAGYSGKAEALTEANRSGETGVPVRRRRRVAGYKI